MSRSNDDDDGGYLSGRATDGVRMYLKEIGRLALLTGEEEVSLARRIDDKQMLMELLAFRIYDIVALGDCVSWERDRQQRLLHQVRVDSRAASSRSRGWLLRENRTRKSAVHSTSPLAQSVHIYPTFLRS